MRITEKGQQTADIQYIWFWAQSKSQVKVLTFCFFLKISLCSRKNRHTETWNVVLLEDPSSASAPPRCSTLVKLTSPSYPSYLPSSDNSSTFICKLPVFKNLHLYSFSAWPHPGLSHPLELLVSETLNSDMLVSTTTSDLSVFWINPGASRGPVMTHNITEETQSSNKKN